MGPQHWYAYCAEKTLRAQVRKTPPGRAVIVAGGFRSGPIGVPPARSPPNRRANLGVPRGASRGGTIHVHAVRLTHSWNWKECADVSSGSVVQSADPRILVTCSTRSQSDVKPGPRSDLVVRHTVTACKAIRAGGAATEQSANATQPGRHTTTRASRFATVNLVPSGSSQVATWLRSPAMLKRAVPQANLSRSSLC